MNKRKFTAEDFMKFKFAYDPQLSVDGSKILYVLSTTEEEKYLPNIWMHDLNDGTDRQFTFGNSDERPRWSPNGKEIAFLSKRNGKKQLFVIPACGGEARPVAEFRYGLGDAAWSPCGGYIAFTATSNEGQTVCDLLKLEEDDKDKAEKKAATVVVEVDRLKFKMNGLPFVGLRGKKKKHIYVVNVATGDIEQITDGEFEESSPVWAPCGKGLVFESHRAADADHKPRIMDLWYVTLEDKKLTKLTTSQGPNRLPTFNADGSMMAFLGNTLEYDSATNNTLYIRNNKTGEIREVTPDYDRSLGMAHGSDMKLGAPIPGPIWSKCGNYVYTVTTDLGQTHLLKIEIATGDVTPITSGNIQVTGYSINIETATAAISYSNATQPGDIGLVNLADGSVKRCTEVNKEILEECFISMPEEFWYKGAEDWDVQGWIMKPYGFKEGVKYPMVLEVHGGPHSAYAENFFYEFQVLCAAGYVVLYTNPRGSQGYGQLFADAVRGDYGGNDYNDLMLAVDYAINLPYVDKARMAVTGGSYGGFMTNWVVGHTNRFKVAVTMRSISNWVSFFGVSDIGYHFGPSEIGCTPWGNIAKMWDASPLKYVENVKTPLLFIHGEEDIRCPIEQADQFYVFLKTLNQCDLKFNRYPKENHELSRSGQPNRRVHRLNAVKDWFNAYIERPETDYIQ